MRLIRYLIIFTLSFLVSCDSNPTLPEGVVPGGLLGSGEKQEKNNLEVTNVDISDDQSQIVVDAILNERYSIHSLANRAYTDVRLFETRSDAFTDRNIANVPELKKAEYIGSRQIDSLKVKMLALVDLSLEESLLKEERDALRGIYALFGNNLYVAFMYGNEVSETVRMSDYILDNYFNARRSSFVYLYRSINEKLNEIVAEDGFMRGARSVTLLVMSDGKVYGDNNMPIDPQHYEMQNTLKDRMSDKTAKYTMYYVNFHKDSQPSEDDIDEGDFNEEDDIEDIDDDEVDEELDVPIAPDDSGNMLKLLCNLRKGKYYANFDWFDMEKDIKEKLGVAFADYRFTLLQPEGKVLLGGIRDIKIQCVDRLSKDTVAVGNVKYSGGGIYDPVVFNGNSTLGTIVKGIINGVLLIIFVYLILQYVEPYIRYQWFKKKYVLHYTGRPMSNAGNVTQESCYLCKAPFVEGDEIVAKCSHTMHKECWDENGYHCTEYGRHCKGGIHYYNEKKLSDVQNALFYMKWALTGLGAGLIAWMFIRMFHNTVQGFMESFILNFEKVEENTPAAKECLMQFGHVVQMPSVAFFLSFFITLALSFFTVSYKGDRKKWLLEIILRGLFAGILGFIIFLMLCMVYLSLNLYHNYLLADIVPWICMTLCIAFFTTFHTRVPVKKLRIFIVSLVAMVLLYGRYYLIPDAHSDLRIYNMIVYMLFGLAVSVCIASSSPRSERYFLHVEGPVKGIDVALYKWFKELPFRHVTIGRSVDCDLQMSWDMTGNLAPINAEIYMDGEYLYLKPVEDGVFIGEEPVNVDQKVMLYHGLSFRIGKNKFTYIEKDV